MSSPLVSILMPCYNAERYIREAINSALAQTYENIELIIIDAESTDRSVEIVQSYKDPRIRLIKHKYESIIATRNALFKEANGMYFTFLDSDDIYLPDKVREEVGFLDKHPDYSSVYCDLKYFFDDAPEKLYRHRYTFYSGNIFPQLLDKLFITNTTFMTRREVVEKIGNYDESLGVVEDWDYFLRIAYAGYKIGFLSKDLVRYRLRWDNHTRFANQALVQQSNVNIIENFKKRMTPEEHQRYQIDNLIKKRKQRLFLVLLADSRRREAWSLCNDIGRYSLLTTLFLLPSFATKLLLGAAWRLKKKKLFIPVA